MRQGGETGRVVELAASDVLTKEVLGWKGLHLFHFSGSSCSQKLRIYMNLKGIAPSLHPVNLVKHENETDWYMGINPRGLVPTLIDDGKVIHYPAEESVSANVYVYQLCSPRLL